MKTMSFAEALREALGQGYRTMFDPMTLIHYDIEESVGECGADAEGDFGWVRVGAYLFNERDAWKRDAVVYTLD